MGGGSSVMSSTDDEDEYFDREYRVLRLTMLNEDRRAKFVRFLQLRGEDRSPNVVSFFLDITAVKSNFMYLMSNPTLANLEKYAGPIEQQLRTSLVTYDAEGLIGLLDREYREHCAELIASSATRSDMSSMFFDVEVIADTVDFIDELEGAILFYSLLAFSGCSCTAMLRRSCCQKVYHKNPRGTVARCQRLCASKTPHSGGKSKSSSMDAAAKAIWHARQRNLLCGWARLVPVPPPQTIQSPQREMVVTAMTMHKRMCES